MYKGKTTILNRGLQAQETGGGRALRIKAAPQGRTNGTLPARGTNGELRGRGHFADHRLVALAPKKAANGRKKSHNKTRVANIHSGNLVPQTDGTLQRAIHVNRMLPSIICQEDHYRTWLRRYQPFCRQLPDEKGNRMLSKVLNECARHTEMRIMPKGSVLFNPGERDYLIYYLLAGQVRIKETTADRSKPYYYIIKSSAPGQYAAPVGGDTALRTAHVQVVRRSAFLGVEMQNPQLLDSLNNVIRTANLENVEGIDDGNWVGRLLNHRWFKLVDGKSVQDLFSYAERVEVSAGEVLQEFNKPVQYVYIIEKGSCLLFEDKPMSLLMAIGMMVNSSGARAHGQPIRMLTPGACFGDVYAINPSDKDQVRPSPFTVQMRTAGVVHRIARADFNEHFGHYVFDWLVGHMDGIRNQLPV
jgi:CRP-like cAMP-binding protein